MNKIEFSFELTGNKETNGWVAEIRGFHRKYKFNNYFPKPKRKTMGFDTRHGMDFFELAEGKMYIIQPPFKADKYYVKIVNGEILKIEEQEVCDTLKEGEQDKISHSSTAKPVINTNLSGELNLEHDFILKNLNEAFQINNHSEIDKAAAEGMILVTWRYAEEYNLTKEFKVIQQSLHVGKTINEIKQLMLKQNRTTPDITTSKHSFLSKYNVPSPV